MGAPKDLLLFSSASLFARSIAKGVPQTFLAVAVKRLGATLSGLELLGS